MTDGSLRELILTVEARILPVFFHQLQHGFWLDAKLGCSIREFLRDRFRLSQETIGNRISTVFLDGQPVDDLDKAFVECNSTLALSGAMPGLVGAVMRSRSPLRSFRSSITHSGKGGGTEHERGLVRLKLFNSVMSELGPSLLTEGILLEPTDVCGSMADGLEKNESGLVSLELDREPIELVLLRDPSLFDESDLVSLSVRTQA